MCRKWCCRTHLITQESLDDSNTLDHDAVKAKVSATVNATQQILSITLLRHVDSYIKLFESTLLSKSGCSKRYSQHLHCLQPYANCQCAL